MPVPEYRVDNRYPPEALPMDELIDALLSLQQRIEDLLVRL
jgi:hypothetical protein